MANHFSNSAKKGLSRMGDLILPASGEFPKYSDVAGLQYIDELVINAPKEDINSLNLLLTILSFMPTFILKWLIGKMATSQSNPSNGFIGVTFRQLDVGLKGLVFTTYYGEKINPNYTGKTPEQLVDFKINRIVD